VSASLGKGAEEGLHRLVLVPGLAAHRHDPVEEGQTFSRAPAVAAKRARRARGERPAKAAESGLGAWRVFVGHSLLI